MLKAQVQSLGWEDPLEVEMETHSSFLAWKFQGQRSLMGYSPWGRKRVEHRLGADCGSDHEFLIAKVRYIEESRGNP